MIREGHKQSPVIQQAIAAIRRRMRSTGREASDVVRELLLHWLPQFSAEERRELIREGLTKKVNTAEGDGRTVALRGQPEERAITVRVDSTRQPAAPVSVFVSVAYSIPAGPRKILLECTAADCRALATTQRRHAEGMLAVARFLDDAAKQIEEAGVATLGDLPAATLRALEAQYPR